MSEQGARPDQNRGQFLRTKGLVNLFINLERYIDCLKSSFGIGTHFFKGAGKSSLGRTQ